HLWDVRITECSPTVIAQSPEGYAEDLTVLKVESSSDVHILPLGISGKRDLKFKTIGWCLYDRRNKTYKLEEIYGHITKPVKIKSRYQDGFVDGWGIRIDDENLLQPGFSGSPLIDNRNRIVIGYISHREEQGKAGQAVSVIHLNRIWKDAPQSLVRKHIYDYELTRKLLISVFKNERDFVSFCLESFNYEFGKNISYLIKIEMFLTYCHENNKFDTMFDCIKQIDEKEYRKFLRETEDNSFINTRKDTFIHNLLNFIFSFAYRREQNMNMKQKRSQCKL